MAEDFPLDISYSEISSWLSNRRKLPPDWTKRCRDLQSKSKHAFQSLPAAVASRFPLPNDTVEYPTARRIRDHLAASAERGVFGGLSGDAGVWDKIVRQYEKNALFLGEAGQRILQNVDYEVPFLKKRMESLDKRIVELARRQGECENNAASATQQFVKECENLGISGGEVRSELDALSNNVYEIFQRQIAALKSERLRRGVEFYRGVTQALHGVDASLPTLQSVFDDAVEPPAPEIIQPFDLAIPQESPQEQEIQSEEIQWDVVPESDLAGPSENEIQVEWEDGGIDWGIEVETTETIPVDPQSIPVDIPEVQKSMGAHGEVTPVVMRCVWDGAFRNHLLDDVYELTAFISVRNSMEAADPVALSFGEIFHKFSSLDLSELLIEVHQILEGFVGEAAQKHLLLKTSRNFADRLVMDFTKKAQRPQEWRQLATQASAERASVQTELSQIGIQLNQCIRQTLELKDLVQKEISPLFNKRQINIMGKINTLTPAS